MPPIDLAWRMSAKFVEKELLMIMLLFVRGEVVHLWLKKVRWIKILCDFLCSNIPKSQCSDCSNKEMHTHTHWWIWCDLVKGWFLEETRGNRWTSTTIWTLQLQVLTWIEWKKHTGVALLMVCFFFWLVGHAAKCKDNKPTIYPIVLICLDITVYYVVFLWH